MLKRFKGCVIFIISPYTLCPLSRSTNLKQYYIQVWKSMYKNKNTLLLTKLIDNGYTSDLIALINYTLAIIRNSKQKQLENICYIYYGIRSWPSGGCYQIYIECNWTMVKYNNIISKMQYKIAVQNPETTATKRRLIFIKNANKKWRVLMYTSIVQLLNRNR